jgi:hypothetical protein
MQHDEDSTMSKKPAPKKPAAKMPTIPRKKQPTVEDLMQELDAAVSDKDLSAEALAKEDAGKTTAAASEPDPPAASRPLKPWWEKVNEGPPTRPPHNLQTLVIIHPAFNKNPALQTYAGRFLDACFAVIENPTDRTNFPAVKKRLTALSLDDPGWLDQIREAIADCASFDDGMKQAILALFEMAVLFVYDSEEP